MIPESVYALPSMRAILLERGDEVAEAYQCPTCPAIRPDLVCVDCLEPVNLPRFVCPDCASGPHREALAAQDGVANAALSPWDKEPGLFIKSRRAGMINETLWTTASGSPLSVANQAQWEAWRVLMHHLTIDFANPGDVVWPEKPGLEYGEVT